ncbi:MULTISPECIES: malate:quinone oxidoreductase [Auritidibacter]|uniref:malate:quinone oxidoreductase n=1 Tax=Auritidibacter TaxID=1160973 RepID=UPI000D7384F5|nr:MULTISPECIES: malate:quinone oxidoreductase [Auritidibacter]AXR73256.1 malate:quinone oxidoreductase [Auritidibacter sp. NML130574]NIH70981.1 malate dehydrogenase (quinone) [Auritidibacter ignavus]PXA82011.1 malate:quinone oxidoreductase [Auritidibacter sp. NML120636]RMX24143.1 malate:quinone oxidoreductase [Auritidibacter ignavus]WGH86425.1 malate:quinone oxidoreductase [Auritidibacter ignavus]
MPHESDSPVYDVVLIGGGIMSATLGTFLKVLEPNWSVALYENLNQAGQESSDPWNNAGTGHAALCELNYSPQQADGSVDITKAVNINEQYHVSEQFWSYLVRNGTLTDPQSFIHRLPHMSFVWGDDHANYLKTRYEAMKAHPLFSNIEYSEDPETIGSWAPLLTEGRIGSQRLAASRVETGTDVDFGALSRQLVSQLDDYVDIRFGHQVKSLTRGSDGRWEVSVKDKIGDREFTARSRFVFIGAGGGALPLLQSSGIPEAKGFGGFPISGKFLRCHNQQVISQHNAKVYGQAQVGAPPMSVPHLDTRFVDGRRSLMFGPYAGFSTNFLKTGSLLDLPLSVRGHNILPMLNVAKDNLDLVKYLVSELTTSTSKKFASLEDFYPAGDQQDWEMITAGQRVQVMKKDAKKGGVLQFGTELVTSEDGTISALLGASPGASTAAPIMLNLLNKCFPARAEQWRPTLEEIIPSFGQKLADNPDLYEEIVAENAKTLKLA